MANFSDYTLNNNVHMWKVLAAWKGKTDHTSSKRCATLCLGANQERCSGTELFSLCLIHLSAPFIVICFLASFVLVFILQVLMLMYFIKLSMLHNGYWSSYWFKFIYTKCVKCFPKRGWIHPDLYNNHWLMNPPLRSIICKSIPRGYAENLARIHHSRINVNYICHDIPRNTTLEGTDNVDRSYETYAVNDIWILQTIEQIPVNNHGNIGMVQILYQCSFVSPNRNQKIQPIKFESKNKKLNQEVQNMNPTTIGQQVH